MGSAGRRDLAHERDRAAPPLDLSRTDLREGTWAFGHFERAVLRDARVEGSLHRRPTRKV